MQRLINENSNFTKVWKRGFYSILNKPILKQNIM